MCKDSAIKEGCTIPCVCILKHHGGESMHALDYRCDVTGIFKLHGDCRLIPCKSMENCPENIYLIVCPLPSTRKTTCSKHGFPCAEAMALGLLEFHWLCGLLCQCHLLLLIFYCRLSVCFSCSLLSHECLYHYCLSSMLFLAKILMEIFIKIVKFCLQ